MEAGDDPGGDVPFEAWLNDPWYVGMFWKAWLNGSRMENRTNFESLVVKSPRFWRVPMFFKSWRRWLGDIPPIQEELPAEDMEQEELEDLEDMELEELDELEMDPWQILESCSAAWFKSPLDTFWVGM